MALLAGQAQAAGQAGGHAGQHEAVLPLPQDGGQGGEYQPHHLGLHPQEDQLGGACDLLVGGHHRPGQLRGQGLRLGCGAVRQQDSLRQCTSGRRPGHGGPHIAGADKADCLIHKRILLMFGFFLIIPWNLGIVQIFSLLKNLNKFLIVFLPPVLYTMCTNTVSTVSRKEELLC